MKLKNPNKYTKYSVAVIILFSIIVLSLASIYHVSGDGCWYVPVGKFIANNHKFPLFEPLGRDEPFWSPPLYHILVAVIYYIFNQFNHDAANFAVKFISPVFGILSLIFSYLVIKKLVNEKIAFYSVIFLAFIPIFIDYSVLSYVESMLVFFVILSIYFLINDKIVLSGIAVGLSILTKYNGIFILPALIYYLYKKSDRKSFYKNSAIIVIVSLLVASSWLIRNWLLLGNPIWPFLNFIFHGYQLKSYNIVNLKNIGINLIIFTFLGFFGVPDGNPAAFRFVSWIPHIMILVAIWYIGAMLFLLFPLFGNFLKSNKNFNNKSLRIILFIWIFSYLVLFLLYVVNVGLSVSRIILPAFPALAIFWALGLEKILENKFTKIFKILIIFIITGLLYTTSTKFLIASNNWNIYITDFQWVKSNTNQDAIFIANGQCVPYNIERTSVYYSNENLKKADYIWVNQGFVLDRRSILDEDELKLVQSQKYDVAYSNKDTGTIIYKIKQ